MSKGSATENGSRAFAAIVKNFFPEGSTIYVFLNRAWSIVSTLVFISLVITQLSPELQGFYFTFFSLLILMQVADMGFGIVLTQFCSHEWADLHFDDQGEVDGAQKAKANLASLVRVGIKWYGVAAFIFFAALGAGGHIFFASQPESAAVEWQTPWWLLCTFAVPCLLLIPVACLLEGCHQVRISQRNQLIASVCASVAGWVVLFMGAQLYTVAIIFATRGLIGHVLNTMAAMPILRLWRHADLNYHIPWRSEFWPQQWRIWISWLAGMFIFQSFTPIAFQMEGAVAAGQIGVMVQAFHAVNQLASSRLSGDQPKMGALAARKDFEGLRKLVRVAAARNVASAAVLAVLAIGFVSVIKAHLPEIGMRLGDILGFAIFIFVAIPLQIGNVETAAIRFQKKEPFIAATVVPALLITAGNLIFVGLFNITAMPIVFFIITIFVLIPWVHSIYKIHMNVV